MENQSSATTTRSNKVQRLYGPVCPPASSQCHPPLARRPLISPLSSPLHLPNAQTHSQHHPTFDRRFQNHHRPPSRRTSSQSHLRDPCLQTSTRRSHPHVHHQTLYLHPRYLLLLRQLYHTTSSPLVHCHSPTPATLLHNGGCRYLTHLMPLKWRYRRVILRKSAEDRERSCS